MTDKNDDEQLSEEDRELFKESMRDVKPLSEGKDSTQPRSRIVSEDIDDEISGEDFLSDFESEAPVTSSTVLFYADSSISHKIIKKLKHGKIPVSAELDLHGMIIDQAHDILQKFLREAQQKGYRCVRIVHGKGHKAGDRPKLKNKVNNWLRQPRCVLAFCSATPQDGGTGAVYVLLRR